MQRNNRRLQTEFKQLQKTPSDMFHAYPLPENLLNWHFTIKGVPGSLYEGGLYHGEVLIPEEYPMKGPDIIFHTPNGRFETHKPICLSNYFFFKFCKIAQN